MKLIKRVLLGLTLAGPAVTPLACNTLLATEIRDAAIAGAAGFVETAVADALDRAFGPDEPAE